jgi:hypothetical protein
MAQSSRQSDGQRRVRNARNVPSHFFERPIADDIVGADAQNLTLPKTPESPQNRGILEPRIHFALQLFFHFRLAGTISQGHAQHLNEVGMADEQITEELTGAQHLEKRLQATRAVVEQWRKLAGTFRVSEETLEAIERHVGIGTAWKDAAQRVAQVCQGIDPEDRGKVSQIPPTTLAVAEMPTL